MVQRHADRLAGQRVRPAGARHVRQPRTQSAARARASGRPTRRCSRTSRSGQARRLEVRIEAVNIFNHVNLGNPDGADWRARQRQPERRAHHGHGRPTTAQLPVRVALHLLTREQDGRPENARTSPTGEAEKRRRRRCTWRSAEEHCHRTAASSSLAGNCARPPLTVEPVGRRAHPRMLSSKCIATSGRAARIDLLRRASSRELAACAAGSSSSASGARHLQRCRLGASPARPGRRERRGRRDQVGRRARAPSTTRRRSPTCASPTVRWAVDQLQRAAA